MTATKRETVSAFLKKYAIYFILVLMIIIMAFLKPGSFLTFNNIANILRQMTPIGIMALGVTFCIITAGTDLSGGSILAMCSVVAAQVAHLSSTGTGMNPVVLTLLATLAAIAAGGAAGTVNGIVISYGQVPPFIATLGMMSIARGAAMLISGGRPIGGFDATFNYLGNGLVGGLVPAQVIIFILCAIIAFVLLHRTKFGTYVYAIGGNENAAQVSGISVKPIKTFVYILAGMFYGIAAVVLTARQQAGTPDSGLSYDMEAITCAIIGGSSFSGGIGTIPGTFVGALIMGVLANGMTMLQVNPNWQMVVKGSVIILAVLFDMLKNRSK